MRHVVVVGAGAAGTAAALEASRGGARVTIVDGGTGATSLAGGALDDVPWEETVAAPEPVNEATRRVLDALGGYAAGQGRALIATTAGLVRPARATSRALLDLAPLSHVTIMVAHVARSGWDAPALARAWSASPRARGAGLSFVPVAASLLKHTSEHTVGDVELAARHDDPLRLEWLAHRIKDGVARAGQPIGAVILPPCLGLVEERGTALTRSLGIPAGEAQGLVGGPAGLRFENARDRALAAQRIQVVRGRVARVARAEAAPGGWTVDFDADPHPSIACEAVVLATGGVIGGGLEYTPSGATFGRALPDASRPLLRLTCEAPAKLGIHGKPLEEPSSLFGASPETHAWPFVDPPIFESAGVLARASGEVKGAPAGLYATGELVAGLPHTWLGALSHGAKAGAAAARR